MVRTVATIAFIAGVGGVAAFMFQKQTTLKGHVIAADLMELYEGKSVSAIDCDDAPITPAGATFICRVEAKDGSRATIEYAMTREQRIVPKRQLGGITPGDPSAP